MVTPGSERLQIEMQAVEIGYIFHVNLVIES